MPTYPSPAEEFAKYQTSLKSRKPDFNPNDSLSDFNIRGQVITGSISGIYADQKKINDDTFVKDAREEAALRKGDDYNIARQPATRAATVNAKATGTPGSQISAGAVVQYLPTNFNYQVVTAATIGADGTALLSIQAASTGQAGNVKAPDTLTLQNPPTGVQASISLLSDMAGGTEIETIESYKARLLSRLQREPAGGNQGDFGDWAFQADPSVRGRKIVRFGRGLGTVDVYITTGTTNVDAAIMAGQSIVRLPSPELIATVQAYYEAKQPYTDCTKVFSPVEIPVDVTVKVLLSQGYTLSSVPADSTNNPLNLTVAQLITREVRRVIYKYASGGRVLSGQTDSGYVVASDIEAGIKKWLSGVIDENGLTSGIIPVLDDWQVQPLNGTQTNFPLIANQLPAPGNVTIIVGA